MNIFIIPLWYPSVEYPISGTFIKEQALAICKQYSTINVGVSIWGQKEEKYLLWVKDHLKNLSKLIYTEREARSVKIAANFREYYKPTFTWTNSILKGNFDKIVEANLYNAKAFVQDYGKIDVIHAHPGYIAGAIASELSKALNAPYIITEHMGPFPGHIVTNRKGEIKPWYRKPYLESKANISVSPSLANEMAAYGIPNIVTIPNFVSERIFNIPLNYKAPENKFTFLTLASITPDKGINLLLRAFKAVNNYDKRITLRIGGRGTHLEEYKKLAYVLNISKAVTWLGEITRKDVVEELQQCNAFILPSKYETMGIAYVEALACGKPIIATECGGPESIVSSTNGILVEKGNVTALSHAMIKLAKSIDKYSATEIRENFMRRFSERAVIPQLIKIYKEVSKSKTHD